MYVREIEEARGEGPGRRPAPYTAHRTADVFWS